MVTKDRFADAIPGPDPSDLRKAIAVLKFTEQNIRTTRPTQDGDHELCLSILRTVGFLSTISLRVGEDSRITPTDPNEDNTLINILTAWKAYRKAETAKRRATNDPDALSNDPHTASAAINRIASATESLSAASQHVYNLLDAAAAAVHFK